MAGLTHYRFRSVWTADVSPEEAFAVLEDLSAYPHWWPEVKEVSKVSDGRFELRCRSLLPYDLRFVGEQRTADRDRGILELDMTGDLEGFSRWTITGGAGHSHLVFDEEVVTNKKMLNRLAPIARPFFKVNHTLMMRHGEAGLRTFLAGYGFAKRESGSG